MTGFIRNKPVFFLFLLALALVQPGCERPKSNKPPGHTETAQPATAPDMPSANESAYETVLRELRKDPDNLKEIYHLADLYYRDGKYEEAIENYRKVVSKDPERGYVLLRLATSYSRIERYDEAIDAFQKAIPNLSDPAVAYNNMGITYGRMGRYQEEIEALQSALKHRPRYASALYNLGVTMLKVGDVEGARQQYESLNEFDLTMAEALLKEINNTAPQSPAKTNEQ